MLEESEEAGGHAKPLSPSVSDRPKATGVGRSLGEGDPHPGMSHTHACWLLCPELRSRAGLSDGCLYPAPSDLMAIASSREHKWRDLGWWHVASGCDGCALAMCKKRHRRESAEPAALRRRVGWGQGRRADAETRSWRRNAAEQGRRKAETRAFRQKGLGDIL